MPRDITPENEKPVNVHWLVRVAGCDEELLVYAAYAVYHPATDPASVHAIGEHREHLLATFKNADHKVVFQTPAAAVAYVRRADVTGKVDKSATPNQFRELKDELSKAAEGLPAQPAVHITMNPTTHGAAGVPQTVHWTPAGPA